VRGPAEGLPGLRATLSAQRVLWLRQALYRVVTNPEIDVKTVRRLVCSPPALKEVEEERPGVLAATAGEEGYVVLTWDLSVELPLEKVPVLLDHLATSPRHLQVTDFGLQALPKVVVDFQTGESPTQHEAEEFKGGAAAGPRGREMEWEAEMRVEPGAPGLVEPRTVRRLLDEVKFREGHLILFFIQGVSYDFLTLPEGYKGWPT